MQKQILDLKHLEQQGVTLLEYIWIDGIHVCRGKTRTVKGDVTSLDQVPEWNYDGSSTHQAETKNSEVILKPVALFNDPFRQYNNKMVLCEAWKWADTTFKEKIPANTNFRHFASKIFEAAKDSCPWFGIEQEYTLLGVKNKFTIWPLGWPSSGFPGPQGPYYCSIGANHCFGRAIMDNHAKACLYAGVTLSGTNAEVMPGQWEFQVGPCEGIKIGDELWMARYLLVRVAEEYNVCISFAPKLFKDWNGAGCHTNFSDAKMRKGEGGMEYINKFIEKLGPKLKLHIELYGENMKRLTGEHETSTKDEFSYGIGNRAASVRIPTSTAAEKKGYIEDRRPASDIDPYVVGAMLVDTCILDSKGLADPLVDHYRKWIQQIQDEGLDEYRQP